jgi:hypothetical protein
MWPRCRNSSYADTIVNAIIQIIADAEMEKVCRRTDKWWKILPDPASFP